MTRPCVLALGFFDGVHIGHGGLLRRTRETADRLGVPAAALTFDTHPDTLVSGHSVPLLNTPEDRARRQHLVHPDGWHLRLHVRYVHVRAERDRHGGSRCAVSA